MLSRIESRLRNLLRLVSRNTWAYRLLGLQQASADEDDCGIIMIQIDGLSNRQLRTAIDNNRMPFLKRLLVRENYALQDLYSGLPSTTPAVQGEIFYGVPGSVPAFAFYDRRDNRVRKMYEPSSTQKVEKTLRARGTPLFEGGSTYSDVFTGGAQEAHFCPAAMELHRLLRTANPVTTALLVLLHLDSVVRIAILTIVEILLAIVDFFRGTLAGHSIKDEFKFILTRVGICIVLRELISIGVRIDIARGIRSIHLNLIGYDEQAHRRGPSSAFAHWTLTGIDRVIARIWRASHAVDSRDYEVWIYSDHGQQEVLSYPATHKISVDKAIEAVVNRFTDAVLSTQSIFATSHAANRGLTGKTSLKSDSKSYQDTDRQSKTDLGSELHVIAMGPVGFVYCDGVREDRQWAEIAEALVADAYLPLVLRKSDDSTVTAWTRTGVYRLPEQSAEVLGADHPFLDETTQDLIQLCHHKDAGDLVFSGWRPDAKPYSFGSENGAHAGPGFDETHAFALLPGYTRVQHFTRQCLRPVSLREAAQAVLGKANTSHGKILRDRNRSTRRLRIMTYNAHMCIGMDAKASPERIARVINSYQPDIVCLQELDVNSRRTGHVDQALELANLLQMDQHFHGNLHFEQGAFGNAILTALPMTLVKAAALPTHPDRAWLDPRGAIWVIVKLAECNLQILNTHLGLYPRERLEQIQALTSTNWLENPSCRSPRILCGDLNATATSRVGRHLSEYLVDAQEITVGHRPKNTFFGRYPIARIDHIYVDSALQVRSTVVGDSALARMASDHLPLIVEIDMPTMN